MTYETLATSVTPALVIYVLDVSASMNKPLGEKRRIDVVMGALSVAIRQMIFRSTKGSRIAPRYRIGMLAYSQHVYDLLDGIQPVDRIAQLGVPELKPLRTTDTATAFVQAEKLLKAELANLRDCPAPLVCHMTDGEYTGEDPEPVARRIMQLSVPDGNVLVENIFISDKSEAILADPVREDVKNWSGVLPETPLANKYARKLRSISSSLPESYRTMMLEMGYNIAHNALMLLPGTSPELVAMGFQMSTATPVR